MFQSLPIKIENTFANYLSSSIGDNRSYTFNPAINNEELKVPYVVVKVVSQTEVEEMPWQGVFNFSFQSVVVTNARDSGSLYSHDHMIESVRSSLADPQALRTYINSPTGSFFLYTIIPGQMMNQIMADNRWHYIADYELIAQAGYNPSAVIYD